MQRLARLLFTLVLLLTVGFSGHVFADTFEKNVSQAMQNLNLSKGDAGLLVLTNAPYIKADGANALPWLNQAQEKTGCTVGKGNLLFFQRAQSHPFSPDAVSKDRWPGRYHQPREQ